MKICSITVSEEKSRSLLYEDFFPCQTLSQLENNTVKAYFETVFRQYGLPKMIKVDNGYPWKSPNADFPTPLALWWVGLGIKIRWNRPYRPQENAVVENDNGLVTRWAEVHQKQTIEEVKAALDWIGIFQREKIKVKRCNGKTRLEKYPDLYKIQRPYSESSFDFERCKQFIEDNYQWHRIISKAGQIDFCNQRIYIDKNKHTNSISIQYIAKLDTFEIRDEQNLLLKSFQIETWKAENILQFNLFQRTDTKNK